MDIRENSFINFFTNNNQINDGLHKVKQILANPPIETKILATKILTSAAVLTCASLVAYALKRDEEEIAPPHFNFLNNVTNADIVIGKSKDLAFDIFSSRVLSESQPFPFSQLQPPIPQQSYSINNTLDCQPIPFPEQPLTASSTPFPTPQPIAHCATNVSGDHTTNSTLPPQTSKLNVSFSISQAHYNSINDTLSVNKSSECQPLPPFPIRILSPATFFQGPTILKKITPPSLKNKIVTPTFIETPPGISTSQHKIGVTATPNNPMPFRNKN